MLVNSAKKRESSIGRAWYAMSFMNTIGVSRAASASAITAS